ncbi:MAG: response regulator [Pseudomonadota bacterium]
MEIKILVVDDEDDVRNMIAAALEKFGYSSNMADSVKLATELMESTEYDIIITDKNMPDDIDGSQEGGMNVLKYAKKHMPTAEVLIMTGYATIETAIEAMRLSAFDYIIKPFLITELKEKVDRILEYKSFINPGNTIPIYKTLHNEILNLLENKHDLAEDERHKLLKSLDTKIDHFFRAQKEWEKVILVQRDALAKIGAYAEELKEYISQTGPSYSLLEKICEESGRRL